MQLYDKYVAWYDFLKKIKRPLFNQPGSSKSLDFFAGMLGAAGAALVISIS